MQQIISGEMKSGQLLNYEKAFTKEKSTYEKVKVSCFLFLFFQFDIFL
jgi:hypothetical protein